MKKHLLRFVVLSLILTLSLSVCGCSTIKSLARDIPRITEFTGELLDLARTADADEITERLDEFVHPKSNLNKDSIIEKFKSDEDLADIDLETLFDNGYSVGNFSDPDLKLNDPDLDGNIYEVTVDLTAGEYTFIVTIDILSDDSTIGVYDIDVSR